MRVSFTDDRSNPESLTSTAAVAPAPGPLTVSLSNNPASHNGQNVFTFEMGMHYVLDVPGGTTV